jgi:Zn-dependent protease/CBS domain-containing protein
MPGSIRLGKLAGIDIYVHTSWFIILVLLTWSLASGWFPQFFSGWSPSTYWLMAFISALLLFFCVLVHELAHSLVARAYRQAVKGITLFVFGGIAQIDQEASRPGEDFLVAVAGPLASFLLAGLAFLLLLLLGPSSTPTVAILDYLTTSNILLGIFNLIPGFPLDGGRIFRSIIWKATGNFQKATRIAAFVGQGCGFLFILLGIVAFFTGGSFNGLWIAFIGWFLLSAAQSANTQVRTQSALRGVTVGQVMNRQPVTVPANISLQKLVDDYMLPAGIRAAPVIQGDSLSGLITLSDIGRVERERWASTPVGHAMRSAEDVAVASPGQALYEALQEMVSRDINQLPVMQNSHLVGLLNRESIVRYLQLHHR